MTKIKKSKIIIVIAIIFFSMICICSNSHADSDPNSIYHPSSSLISADGGNLGISVGKVLGAVQLVGYTTAVGMLMYKGIQFLWATPDGKAEIKKQFVPFFIGMVILAGGSTVAGIIASIAMGTNSGS